MKTPNKMLSELMEAAKKENWDLVDKKIPEACKDEDIVKWAFERGLNNPDGNIRDLAASILTEADISSGKFTSMRDKLHKVMSSDSNIYAQYRSAFALANHGPGGYRNEVVQKLRQAEQDGDVSEIAKKYLRKLN